MTRPLRTFAGALYSRLWVYHARTRAEAGRILFGLAPDEWQQGTSGNALSRYTSPVFWCPKRQLLWFEMAVADAPRPIHPDSIPAGMWGGIEAHEADTDIESRYLYGGSRATARVTAAQLREHVTTEDGCVWLAAEEAVALDDSVRTKNDGAALRIAREVASGDSSAMPVLADALEEAGCSSGLVLRHCRSGGRDHVPDCWVVRLVLTAGKKKKAK